MICANEKCNKRFTPAVPWQKCCTKECANRVRVRRNYKKKSKK